MLNISDELARGNKVSREDIEEWVTDQFEGRTLSHSDLEHVCDCLEDLVYWYLDGRPLGGFLSAVLKNDFMQACTRADIVNRKVLPLYAKFVFNCLPADYSLMVHFD